MSNQYVNLERWRGRRDAEALEPETMAYTERPASKSCSGCCFEGQWSAVCKRAAAAAVRAGMRDCDHGVIYILIEQDPRQLAIPGAEQSTERNHA